jgi:hypothetical protein
VKYSVRSSSSSITEERLTITSFHGTGYFTKSDGYSILRQVYGLITKQGVSTIKTNQEIMELYEIPDLAADMNIRGLDWLGHLIRIKQTRSIKIYFERILS